MKKIVIETKMSIRNVKDTIKKVTGKGCSSKFNRGKVYVYCSDHITDEQLSQICDKLSLEIISKSGARAILRTISH